MKYTMGTSSSKTGDNLTDYSAMSRSLLIDIMTRRESRINKLLTNDDTAGSDEEFIQKAKAMRFELLINSTSLPIYSEDNYKQIIAIHEQDCRIYRLLDNEFSNKIPDRGRINQLLRYLVDSNIAMGYLILKYLRCASNVVPSAEIIGAISRQYNKLLSLPIITKDHKAHLMVITTLVL